jgi:hypothetical protein
MKGKLRFWLGAAILLAGGCAGREAMAAPLFGSLSNFDVINDTNEVTHGFEIELEGVHPEDIAFTFGAPYIRYGDPVLVSTSTGTIVRYASPFGAGGWAVGTPVPAVPFTTGGHALFFPQYGGDANYVTAGGEHFGVALNGNPVSTTYRWLLGDAAGNLIPAGSSVKIPAPVWNVAPPADPAAPAAVQVVLPALENDNPQWEFGEAIWVKVFVTELEDKVELDDLLVGNPAVPDGAEPAEVEIEWVLLQAGKNDELDSGLNDVGAGHEAVSRRYEFYEYIGPYNAEDHEALIEDAELHPEAVGNFIGGQNAAVNLEAFGVPEPGGVMIVGIGAVLGLLRRRRM